MFIRKNSLLAKALRWKLADVDSILSRFLCNFTQSNHVPLLLQSTFTHGKRAIHTLFFTGPLKKCPVHSKGKLKFLTTCWFSDQQDSNRTDATFNSFSLLQAKQVCGKMKTQSHAAQIYKQIPVHPHIFIPTRPLANFHSSLTREKVYACGSLSRFRT